MISEFKFTREEKLDIDHLQNLYSIVKTLNILEIEFGRGNVDRDYYQEKWDELLHQFSSTEHNMDKYPGLEIFASMYNLSQWKGAIRSIKGVNPYIHNNDIPIILFKIGMLLVNLTDYIDLDEVSIEDILPKVREINMLMNAASNVINDSIAIDKINSWVMELEAKSSTDRLDKEESIRLKIDLDELRSTIENSK